ncbi:MAG: hypothetical protein IPI11_13685 [Haliscomenobacter sp.]|nr:hypothetical protein [Haliscomenobacter sp.]
MAYGIDICAHRAALGWGSRPLASLRMGWNTSTLPPTKPSPTG